MTVAALHRQLARSFRARQIVMLVERDGRLVVVGEPTGDEIARASMLLASVHTRLPAGHVYVSDAIPGAAILRLVLGTGRGSILLAPVLDRGVAIGAVLVEGAPGCAFDARDLVRLESMVTSGATAFMRSARARSDGHETHTRSDPEERSHGYAVAEANRNRHD